MATISLNPGEHRETLIRNEVAGGRYGSASEVVQDALYHMEGRNNRLDTLRAHPAEGEIQALQGNCEDYSAVKLAARFHHG